jgi:hypothetical protein
MGNLSYHNGGRGVYALGGNGLTYINNTAYDNCHDLGDNCGDVVDIFGLTNSTFDSNIAWTTRSGTAAFVMGAALGRPYSGNIFKNNLTFDGTPGHTAFSPSDENRNTANREVNQN